MDDFPNHPFKILDDEKMQDTIESIKQNDVLVPVMIRPKQDRRYEIVSGHRRHYACMAADIKEMPAIVRDMTDDEATMIMVDSNLQRENILPSEKAFAYKMKLDAMKRQGQRTDLTSCQVGTKLSGIRSDEVMSKEVNESGRTIQRYIRLTELITELLDIVDEKTMSFNAGVELSYLQKEEQRQLYEVMERDECSPSLNQVQRLKKCRLEPSMGIGNFFGIMPESMSKSKLYGVELDSISGRIEQKLYPNSKITIGGFEETNFPDSFFDVVLGNIPFGNFRVTDERYDRYKFNIHDYFIVKSLDKVRAGGVVAFISSKGTLDKKDAFVRKYIAERAELLGAIRLPHTAFLSNTNTEVTTDILFFQKRERLIANAEPDWIKLGETSEGVPVNQYFMNHPEMVLGRMVFDKSMYGNEKETACEPFQDKPLEELLSIAVNSIKGIIPEPKIDIEDIEDTKKISTLPADPNVRNFSFTVVKNEIYFHENSIMYVVNANKTAQMRIKGMIAIRDCVRELIAAQQHNCSDEELEKTQYKLNTLYENYTKKYGLLNSRGNNMISSDDSGYPLLCSLEILNKNGTLKKKADIFTKRTIKPHIAIEKANTPQEALAASLGELARIDLEYMSKLLSDVPKEDIIS